MKRLLKSVGAATLAITLAGCGGSSSILTTTATIITPPAVSITGRVMGGQQPINGATIQLYAAGNTGYGSAYSYTTGTSLLGSHVVTTSGNGDFNITGDYTCPSSSTEVYIEAIGGIPIAGEAANPNIITLAALGPCGKLSSSTYITINELTTVSSIWALAPFMTGPSNIGTSPANTTGLTNAFAAVNELVDTSTGTLNGLSLPAGATIPTNELNTLADIIASCINTSSGGNAGDGSACGNLFALALSNAGSKPTDVVTAALNIAHNPALNVTALNKLATATAPFQPILSAAPSAWTIAIQYPSTAFSAPTGIAADQSGNLWITNKTTHSVTQLSPTGSVTGTYAVGQSGNGAIAIDLKGDAWVADKTSGSLVEVFPNGTAATTTGGGLTTTNSIAIDGSGDIWAAGTSSPLSAFNSSGTPISTTGYTGGGLTNGQTLAITPQ
ncbi:MAG: hypothetical protein WB439_05650 [Acidobacteriaceae bacterium]